MNGPEQWIVLPGTVDGLVRKTQHRCNPNLTTLELDSFLNEYNKAVLLLPSIFSSAGTKTLYAYAKDAAGNVSTARRATVVITLTGITPPPPPNPAAPLNVKIYPNPFRPSEGHRVLTLQNLPGNAPVKIYSTKGQLITEDIRTDPSGDAPWEVPSSVPSGTYIVVPDGSGKKKVLFNIIR